MTPMRNAGGAVKPRVPKNAKKARKPAALIVAEGRITALEDDMKEVKGWLKAIVSTSFLTLLAALGALIAPFFIK